METTEVEAIGIDEVSFEIAMTDDPRIEVNTIKEMPQMSDTIVPSMWHIRTL